MHIWLSPVAAAPIFNHGHLEELLSHKGCVAQVETLLREVAATAGYQRLDKNIRASLRSRVSNTTEERHSIPFGRYDQAIVSSAANWVHFPLWNATNRARAYCST